MIIKHPVNNTKLILSMNRNLPTNTLKRDGMATENKASEPEKSTTIVFDLNEFIDAPDNGGQTEDGPRAEFNALIHRVLSVVKDIHLHTLSLCSGE